MENNKRVIISGGGTGGHIYPALSIANALKRIMPNIEILFVGAENRMEMEKVPLAGYPIIGLPISGFDRKNILKNIKVLLNLCRSLHKATKIIRDFSPNLVIGVGGYASGPVLKQASKMGIPTLIQEQNSYAGVTNKLLAKKASKICVAYSGMERFFPAEKIVKIGNPVRQNFDNLSELKDEALKHFNLSAERPTILVVGGSLGARTINNSMRDNLNTIAESDCQWIWQTGKYYYQEMLQATAAYKDRGIALLDFINRMDLAFAAADIIISRAGAGTISELSLLGKPVILVPSPNVAEDHQTKNALALVEKSAALMVSDSEAPTKLIPLALELINNDTIRKKLSANIKTFAERDADIRIAHEALALIK